MQIYDIWNQWFKEEERIQDDTDLRSNSISFELQLPQIDNYLVDFVLILMMQMRLDAFTSIAGLMIHADWRVIGFHFDFKQQTDGSWNKWKQRELNHSTRIKIAREDRDLRRRMKAQFECNRITDSRNTSGAFFCVWINMDRANWRLRI